MSPRGGKRRGAGRPPSDKPKGVRVMVRFDDATYARLEREADVPVSTYIRELVELALDFRLVTAPRRS